MDLKQWQKDNRWTVTAMAKELGIATTTLCGVGTKTYRPSLLLKKAIVRFTDNKVTLEDLSFEVE